MFQDHNYHNNERDLTDVTEVLSGTDEFFTPETDRKASSAFAEDLKSETAQGCTTLLAKKETSLKKLQLMRFEPMISLLNSLSFYP